jgi:hypothetical protein
MRAKTAALGTRDLPKVSKRATALKYLRKSFLTLWMPTPSGQGLIDATKPAPQMLDYF